MAGIASVKGGWLDFTRPILSTTSVEPLFREFMESGTRPAMVPGDASQAKFAM